MAERGNTPSDSGQFFFSMQKDTRVLKVPVVFGSLRAPEAFGGAVLESRLEKEVKPTRALTSASIRKS